MLIEVFSVPGVSIGGRGWRKADCPSFKVLTTWKGALKFYGRCDSSASGTGGKKSEGPLFLGKEPLEVQLECCLRGCGPYSGDPSCFLPESTF